MDWVEFFESNINSNLSSYVRHHWAYNTPVWDAVRTQLPDGGRIIECGSGAGTYSVMLSQFGYEVTGVELDERMVELARRNAVQLGGKSVRFQQGSILDLREHYGRYDLAYSTGVIEHFRHPDAVRILEEEARCAPAVLVVVPSRFVWARKAATFNGIFERYTVPRLRRVVRDAGLEIVREFGYSAGNKVGRAIEMLSPPIVAARIFKHFAATIGILARSRTFHPIAME